MTETIPLSEPSLEGNELAYLDDAIGQRHLSALGEYSRKCSELLGAAHGAADVVMTTSCTDALELSALLLGIEPGDVVVVPSFTYVSTALAFARQGATIRFCDIEPVTFGMDPNHLEALLDGSVRAVVPVHYAGVGCDIEDILNATQGLPHLDVVEDNADGLFGSYRGEPLGSFGRFSTLSFHETKNFVCGEGGALVVNRPGDVERARILNDKGTNRGAFLRGQVDRHTWVDTGSSFGLSDMLAAFLYGQLERRSEILAKRKVVFERYQVMLEGGQRDGGYSLPVVPEDRRSAYHMYYVILPDRATRDAVIDGMRVRGVASAFHYVPLHSSPYGLEVSDGDGECPVTDDVAGRLLRLPFYNNLSESQADRVVEAFLAALAAC